MATDTTKKGAQKPEAPAAPERGTVTFVPYYWEAYNQIVQPHQWNRYFLDKWAPTLEPTATMIVLVLRRLCFYNREKGVLRDECEITVEELAARVGVSTSTVSRQFAKNEHLAKFVKKQKQYQPVGKQVHQCENRYHVSMDDPIHPDDMEWYEELRAQKERERDTPPANPSAPNVRPRINPQPAQQAVPRGDSEADSLSNSLDGQFDRQGKDTSTYDGQIDRHNGSQIDRCSGGQFDRAIDNLPSGGLVTKELTTAVPVPPINSPQGEAEHLEQVPEEKPEDALWSTCLTQLESLTDETGKPLINKPSFETHIRPMRLASLVLEEGKVGRAQLFCDRAWSVEWVGKRYADHIEQLLSQKLGRLVQVSLEVPK